VKNPEYSDTMYVDELVAPDTVNTMPEKTLEAVADHADVRGNTIEGTAAESQAVFDKLQAAGVDLADVFRHLEEDGVLKFEKSGEELLEATQAQLDAQK
jgi:transaldolase